MRLGNKQFRWFVKLAKHCLKHNMPLIIENPASSRLWIVPGMKKLIESASSSINFVHCAHGAKWMKPTRLVSWNIDVSSLQSWCSSSAGICQYTNQAHQVLSGKLNGRFQTSQASAYPIDFCDKFAKLLSHHLALPRPPQS